MRRIAAVVAMSLAALVSAPSNAAAGMGPCAPDSQGWLICGSGDGAAQVIAKTISPSRRLAFAWRLADRPPSERPGENDPNLENFIVRIEDGTVLAKSRGAYWDLGTKIAKAYLSTAWSPDSRLLFKVEQRAGFASAELFSFAEDDTAIGPFDLVKVIKPALQVNMQGTKDTGNSALVFSARPAMNVDDQGLIHAVVNTIASDSSHGPVYDVTLQVTRTAGSLNANVISVAPYAGTSISIIVH